ncbi:hypothetical protein [Ulvibacterium sp.]|uniref:hypothetical protein n=1 Tax=Ulvibacterium sp. TaxID=2665914 RepID=UPI003BAD28E3
MKKDTIITLSKYSQERWNQYLMEMSIEATIEPSYEIFGDNFAQRIMSIYRSVLTYKKSLLNVFFAACVNNLRIIDKISENSEIIYTYLYLVHETRPLSQKSALINILRDNDLEKMQYGSDNLEELLLKSLINMEDSKNPVLREKIWRMRGQSDYRLYLYVFYFSYMGDNDIALQELKESFLNLGSQVFHDESYTILVELLVDIIPDYITFTDFLEYFIGGKISLGDYNDKLRYCFNEVVQFYKDNAMGSLDLIYFIEDYFNQNERNSNLHPGLLENLLEFDGKRFSSLINNYYGKRTFNTKKMPSTMKEWQSFADDNYKSK